MTVVRDLVSGELQVVENFDLAKYPAAAFDNLGQPPAGVPTGLLAYDTATDSLGADLALARQQRWAVVRERRDAAINGGCATPLGRVDTTEISRGYILGAREMAKDALELGQPFLEAWTMADNSVVAHDASAIVTMSLAVGMHVSACHARARSLRDALGAAADLAAIDAIDLDDGWPA